MTSPEGLEGTAARKGSLRRWCALLLLLAPTVGSMAASAQPPGPAAPQPAPAAEAAPILEKPALALLRGMSERLAAARSLSFTATVSYEYPSRLGPPLLYTVRYEVLLERPNRLRIRMPGDGPPSEFLYDGRTMTAYLPRENLAATAPAPPTIDAALRAAFDQAGIYFPFTDLVVADPYAALADGVSQAFRIGPSTLVGSGGSQMVAWAVKDVFLQMWISDRDNLPQRIRAIYTDDPRGLRHQMDLSDWKLNPPIPAGAFASKPAAAARSIPFQRPALTPPVTRP